jgi:hypothetical protein
LPNTVLATFQAHDPDTGFNTQILYYMNGSDILHSFALNSYTGQFSVTSQLDQSPPKQLKLTKQQLHKISQQR